MDEQPDKPPQQRIIEPKFIIIEYINSEQQAIYHYVNDTMAPEGNFLSDSP
jgi:hypothetical protein